MNSVTFQPTALLVKRPAGSNKQPRFGGQLTIQQSAQVEKMPDSVQVNFAVSLSGKSQEEVIEQINAKTEPLVKAFEALKMKNLKVATSAINVYARYATDKQGRTKQPLQIEAYTGSQSLSATIKGVKQDKLSEVAARLVSTGLKNGGEGLHGPYFSLSDAIQRNAEKSAIRKAIRVAREIAQSAAQAAGKRLSTTEDIEIGNPQPNYGGFRKAAPMRAMAAAESMGGGNVSDGAIQIEPQQVSSPPVTVRFTTEEAPPVRKLPAKEPVSTSGPGCLYPPPSEKA